MPRLWWVPWLAETGASRAPAPTGNVFIARRREDAGHTLYYGGLHIGTFANTQQCRRAAERIEADRTNRTNRKGPTT